MSDRKFYDGDIVAVRPFDEIDFDDIGDLSHDEKYCFGIVRSHIEEMSRKGYVFRIDADSMYYDENGYTYDIVDMYGSIQSYRWAQGMLYGLTDQFSEPVEEPGGDSIMDFLFG